MGTIAGFRTKEELREGGPGSGFHGHAGRPGKVGGSLPQKGTGRSFAGAVGHRLGLVGPKVYADGEVDEAAVGDFREAYRAMPRGVRNLPHGVVLHEGPGPETKVGGESYRTGGQWLLGGIDLYEVNKMGRARLTRITHHEFGHAFFDAWGDKAETNPDSKAGRSFARLFDAWKVGEDGITPYSSSWAADSVFMGLSETVAEMSYLYFGNRMTSGKKVAARKLRAWCDEKGAPTLADAYLEGLSEFGERVREFSEAKGGGRKHRKFYDADFNPAKAGSEVMVELTTRAGKVVGHRIYYRTKSREISEGGKGSGHHGHAGRKGKVGGSAPGKVSRQRRRNLWRNVSVDVSDEYAQEQLDDFMEGTSQERFMSMFAIEGYDTEVYVSEGDDEGIKIVGALHRSGKPRVSTGLHPGGKPAAKFERLFYYEFTKAGPVKVCKNVALEVTTKNTGLGKSLYENQLQTLRRSGFGKVVLFADISIGRYAWAKQGFTYSKDQSQEGTTLKQARTRFKSWLRSGGYEVPSLSKFNTPADFANYDTGIRVRGESISNSDVPWNLKLSLGKAFMLDMEGGHGTWHGERLL